jgi:outer membrane immunogenic protein
MRNVLLGSLALAATIASPAMAADMPLKAPPPPVAVFSWTGCYAGGNVGGLWVHKEGTDVTPGDPRFGQSFGTGDGNSWLGGVQAGCNYQFADRWVVGIQGDYDWTDVNSSSVDALFPGLRDNLRVKSLASVTARVGYTWDRFLGYVKGGGAWQRDDYNATVIATNALLDTASDTAGGWTVGIGGEYAFTNWLTGFAEYDYYQFDTHSVTFTCVVAGCVVTGASSTPVDVRETKSVFKVGLNFLWGGGR